MAATDSGIYLELETTLGGKGSGKTTVVLPDATATKSAFKSLDGMDESGEIRITINKQKLVIPLLYDA